MALHKMHDTYDNDKLSAGDSKVIIFRRLPAFTLRYLQWTATAASLHRDLLGQPEGEETTDDVFFLVSTRSRGPPSGAYWQSTVEQPPPLSSSSNSENFRFGSVLAFFH